MRFGGVAYDLPDDVRGQETMEFLRRTGLRTLIRRLLDQGDRLMTNNEIVRGPQHWRWVFDPCGGYRLQYGWSVCCAPAVSTMMYAALSHIPITSSLDFDIPVYYNGDVYDRYLVRDGRDA
jgi:NADH-quinone oxidoreductase subunit C/D